MKQITFRLQPGQLLKEAIREVVEEQNIQAGCLLSIVGGLENANLRMAVAEPGKEVVKSYSGPLEIVSGTGTISRDGCHIHISLSDREGNVVGGHLKDGCRIKYTAEIVLLIFNNVSYNRILDKRTGYKELVIE